ncbi:ankyrin repeat domain-containing protein [Burkholderia contaminans]|uniref:ankyrin repeat domain-containing protein n=1 Tax=Burkholderia contaminans TaxID=488447 RepID=UPI001589B0AE|nr:ankyrin repeat domain-containing protein [Burkholderia contaminans]
MQKRKPVSSLDAMTVFQEDLEIMNGYTHEQVVQYIANAEQSLKSIEQDTIPDGNEKNYAQDFYKEPFTLFTNIDPGSTYYRFSLVPYDESIKEEFRDKWDNIGNYIKTDYDYIESVEFCLSTYLGYLNAMEKNFQEGVSTNTENFIHDYEEFLDITKFDNKADLQSVKSLFESQHFHPAILERAANNQLQYNDTDLIEFFLENGMNATNTLLAISARNSNQEMMGLLVRYGGDIHGNNEQAIRTACSSGNADVVKYLLENGANLKEPNKYSHFKEEIGSGCLDNAVCHNHKEVVEILLDYGMDVNDGLPLVRSLQQGHYDMAEFLLNREADYKLALKNMGYGQGNVVLPQPEENEQTENPALAQLRQMLQGNNDKRDAQNKRNAEWLLDTVSKIELAKSLETTLEKPGKADRLVSSINEDAEAPAKKSKSTRQKI